MPIHAPMLAAAQQSGGPSMMPPPVTQNPMTGSQALGAPGMSNDILYIAGLPAQTDDDTLEQAFSAYGDVTRCKIMHISSGCCGLINFKSRDDAQWVVENVHGNIPDGLQTPVFVRFATAPYVPQSLH